MGMHVIHVSSSWRRRHVQNLLGLFLIFTAGFELDGRRAISVDACALVAFLISRRIVVHILPALPERGCEHARSGGA